MNTENYKSVIATSEDTGDLLGIFNHLSWKVIEEIVGSKISDLILIDDSDTTGLYDLFNDNIEEYLSTKVIDIENVNYDFTLMKVKDFNVLAFQCYHKSNRFEHEGYLISKDELSKLQL